MKRVIATPHAPPGLRRFPRHLLADELPATKSRLKEGQDFRFIRLDNTRVCRSKKRAQLEGKSEGERLFQGMLRLLKDNFPRNEIENEPQYRRYFYDRRSADWFVDLALDNSGKVIGASLYSYSQEASLVMYNIAAVDKGNRQKGVASALISRMIESSKKRAAEAGSRFDYIASEIEQPDLSLSGEGARLGNVIRPAFHDNTTLIRAIRLPDGSPLTYLLPIMATPAERAAAKKSGEPLEPEPLMFCIRPISKSEAAGISPREAARLLIWFYKDYLEAECSDVRTGEVNRLLPKSLSQLAPGVSPRRFEALLKAGKKHREDILSLLPDTPLGFMKISECPPLPA